MILFIWHKRIAFWENYSHICRFCKALYTQPNVRERIFSLRLDMFRASDGREINLLSCVIAVVRWDIASIGWWQKSLCKLKSNRIRPPTKTIQEGHQKWRIKNNNFRNSLKWPPKKCRLYKVSKVDLLPRKPPGVYSSTDVIFDTVHDPCGYLFKAPGLPFIVNSSRINHITKSRI